MAFISSATIKEQGRTAYISKLMDYARLLRVASFSSKLATAIGDILFKMLDIMEFYEIR